MFRESISHAYARTRKAFGLPALILPLVATNIIGFGIHYSLYGYSDMIGEVDIWLIYGLAATGLLFILVFLFNLICAPYRIANEARDRIKFELQEAVEKISELENEISKTKITPIVGDISLSSTGDKAFRYWVDFTVNRDIEKLSIVMDYRFWIGREEGKWGKVTRHKVKEFYNLIKGQTKTIDIVEQKPNFIQHTCWAVGDTTKSGFNPSPPNYAKAKIVFIGDGAEHEFRIIAMPRMPDEKLRLIAEDRFADDFFADEKPFLQA